ncbi:hypothetical protein SH668x_001725 [Planctomicrobium sp. SH668]|uniref:hypothetical protein n=1 Tax=Planctomicrobium sp. SH668 TaxID=3448126 RepID=UPI003F5C9C6B
MLQSNGQRSRDAFSSSGLFPPQSHTLRANLPHGHRKLNSGVPDLSTVVSAAWAGQKAYARIRHVLSLLCN